MHKSFEEVMMMVSSSNADERALGLRYIGKHRYRTALDVCILSLADEHNDVRAWAAWALDQLGSPETIPDLVAVLKDPEFGVRSNAGWALVHLARRWSDALVVPLLVDILEESTNDDARQMAYLVLHHIGGEDARRAMNDYWR